MYGFKILSEISKGTFEISHKFLNLYTAKYAFYYLQFLHLSYDILDCDVISLSETGPWYGFKMVGEILRDITISKLQKIARMLDWNRQWNGCWLSWGSKINTYLTYLPPGEKGRHFAEHVFRCNFMNEKFCNLIKIIVPKVPMDNNPVLV